MLGLRVMSKKGLDAYGQGAFYSERFFFHDGDQLKSKHNIVFDCGVMRWPEWMMHHVVKSAFTGKDEIDHLFISHLDYDHLSLVNTLLKSAKCVKNIVLPLVSEELLITAMTYYQMVFDNDMVDFFREVINRMYNRQENLTVHFVGDEKQEEMAGALIWPRGQVREAQWKPDWVFIPYNMNYCSRRQELHDEFEKVVKDKAFTDAIKLNGIEPIKDADDLFERLKNSEFTKIVLTIRKLRKTIKGSYEKISGKTNENSLLLYSGPIESDGVYRMLQTLPIRRIRYHDMYRAGCLYTGDNTCDMEDWEKKYADVWKYIGTIQLPHHGSVDSFDVTKNVIDRRYVFPVSYGCDNLYGHPSGEVLAYLLANRCCVESVTEKADSVYMQRIER